MTHFISPKAFIPFVFIVPLLLVPSLFHPEPALAADCVSKACIHVYTQNGQIIIEGRKGAGAKSKPAQSVAPKPRPTRAVKARPKPKPVARVTIPPRPKASTTAPRKPYVKPARKLIVPRKVAPKVHPKAIPKVAAGVSLNDRLVKLLPLASIVRQPTEHAIVNVPVIYWCNLPEVFTTKVAIIGEVIDVTMRPAFLWSFGDGSFFATTKAGAAFPQQVISHTYDHAGTYVVTMLATWGGTWSHNGVARAITGEVRKVSITTVNIANGPTRIMG
jgi:hypothetical protein